MQIVQRLDGEIAHETVLAIPGIARAKGGDAGVARQRVAVDEAREALAHLLEARLVDIDRDAAAHRGHEGAELQEGLPLQALGAAGEGVGVELRLQLQRLDIALDAAERLGAGDHAAQRRLQRLAGKIQARPIQWRLGRRRARRPRKRRHCRHSAAARTGALKAPSADIAAACPCAIESSIVSGPVAAPAT